MSRFHDSLTWGRDTERLPHTMRCLLCKELLGWWALARDEAYANEARTAIVAHLQAEPMSGGEPCRYAGCVLHETVSPELARAMIRVGRGDGPRRDIHGHQVGTIPLDASEDDSPELFRPAMQDAVHRHPLRLRAPVGDVFVRFGRKRAFAHLWISPGYPSRREDVRDLPAVWDIVETFERRVPDLTILCLEKYHDLKDLAELELAIEGAPGGTA